MSMLLQATNLSFLSWILSTSAKASIFIFLLIGVKFLFRHKVGARFQYMLWVILMIGLILPWTPKSPLSLYNFLDTDLIISLLEQTSQSRPAGYEDKQYFSSVQAVDMNAKAGNIAINSKPQELDDDPSDSLLCCIIFFLWVLGVLTITILTVVNYTKIFTKLKYTLVTDPKLLSEFDRLKTEMKIKARIPLFQSSQLMSPSLLGLFRPRLLLPEGLGQTFNSEQIKHIFLHELFHYKRKDLWVNWLAQILVAIYWFNPLIWYAFSLMREDQEISCDALAISQIGSNQFRDYATTLVQLAETYSLAPKIVGAANLFSSKSQIKRRIIRITELKQTSFKWSLLGIMVIGVIALVTFTNAKAEAHPNLKGNTNEINFKELALKSAKANTSSLNITISDISGPNFQGKVMLIKDPKRIKLAVTPKIGLEGERVSDLVRNEGALAGINAGGFYDPNGKGNGALPEGLTMHDGKLIHNNVGNQAVNIVGFNSQGKLVIGEMNAKQLVQNNLREAVTFGPKLVAGGKSLISGDGGWGIAPRTGIGQRADGTVIFVVIDGRQPAWSIGATLNELAQVFVDYHAVNAVNLDGGSSSEMVYQGKVLNRLNGVFGERYIPTAFIVTS